MAVQVRHFYVTVPAGTPVAAPLVTDVTVPVMTVRSLHWSFPPGCVGLVGFYWSMGKIPVHPLPPGTFITGDGESGSHALDDLPDSGAWQITAYNLGANPHTLDVSLALDPIIRPADALELIDARQLSRYTTMFGGPGD